MTFSPGAFASTASARSAVTKSPGTNSPGVVDEEAAVGVAVVRDPEIRALLRHLRDDELAVLGQERVRLVVREAPVRLEVAADDVELREALEHRRQHHAGHPVRGVDDDAQRTDARRRRRRRAPSRRSSARRPRSRTVPRRRRLGPNPASARARISARPESPPTGSAPRRTIFIPVYSFGIVRRGDADPAVEAELGDRVVEHLRPDEAELDDVGAARRRCLRQQPRHRTVTRGACRGRRATDRGSKCSAYARATRYAPSSSSCDG